MVIQDLTFMKVKDDDVNFDQLVEYGIIFDLFRLRQYTLLCEHDCCLMIVIFVLLFGVMPVTRLDACPVAFIKDVLQSVINLEYVASSIEKSPVALVLL